MERPPVGTPAQQAAAQFKNHIDQQFKPTLMDALSEVRPFSLLAKLNNYYIHNRSMLPGIRELCSSFMLSLKHSRASLGSKIADLGPSEVEQAWQKEWTAAQLSHTLDDAGTTVKKLKQDLMTSKNRFTLVEQQEFYNLEQNLREKERLLKQAQNILAQQDHLQQLQEKPLQLFRSKEFRKTYNDTFRQLYSLQTIDSDAQDVHPNELPLLFQLCKQNLSKQEFEQMLHFLTSGEQKLLINQKVNEETLLDYATNTQLEADYIEIIKRNGGKSGKPPKSAIRTSSDLKPKKSISWSTDPSITKDKYLA